MSKGSGDSSWSMENETFGDLFNHLEESIDHCRNVYSEVAYSRSSVESRKDLGGDIQVSAANHNLEQNCYEHFEGDEAPLTFFDDHVQNRNFVLQPDCQEPMSGATGGTCILPPFSQCFSNFHLIASETKNVDLARDQPTIPGPSSCNKEVFVFNSSTQAVDNDNFNLETSHLNENVAEFPVFGNMCRGLMPTVDEEFRLMPFSYYYRNDQVFASEPKNVHLASDFQPPSAVPSSSNEEVFAFNYFTQEVGIGNFNSETSLLNENAPEFPIISQNDLDSLLPSLKLTAGHETPRKRKNKKRYPDVDANWENSRPKKKLKILKKIKLSAEGKFARYDEMRKRCCLYQFYTKMQKEIGNLEEIVA